MAVACYYFIAATINWEIIVPTQYSFRFKIFMNLIQSVQRLSQYIRKHLMHHEPFQHQL